MIKVILFAFCVGQLVRLWQVSVWIGVLATVFYAILVEIENYRIREEEGV